MIGSLQGQVSRSSDSDWFFRKWETEDGLPSNNVRFVTQTPDGYLWLGTNGLLRFNGRDFERADLQEELNLPSREVRSLFQDRQGRLWLGTERGPVIVLGEDEFRTYDENDGLPPKRVLDVADDPNGTIWFAYHDSVGRIENNEVTTFPLPSSPEPRIECDQNGTIWIASRNRLMRFSEGEFDIAKGFPNPVQNLTSSRTGGLWLVTGNTLGRLTADQEFQEEAQLPEGVKIHQLLEDSKGGLWISTRKNGLLRFVEGTLEKIPTSYPWVEGLCEDKNGNIWAGTNGGGLNLIQSRSVRLIRAKKQLPAASIQSITFDENGKTWLVDQNGGLFYQSEANWKRFSPDEPSLHYRCVVAGTNGEIWAGTKGSGLLKITNAGYERLDKLNGLHIRSLLQAENGDLLIGTDHPARLYRYSEEQVKALTHEGSLQFIRAIAQTADGTIWIGTSEGRLLKVEEDTVIEETIVRGSSLISIRTLHATPDGSLWIGYAGDGLGHLKDGEYQRFTSEEGLPDNYLSQIQHDDYNSLWIVGNRGLFQVSISQLLELGDSQPYSLRVRTFGRNDGLPSIQPSHNYAPDSTRDSRGHLFFTSSNGILQVNPANYQENALPPPIQLEKLHVDGQQKGFYQKRDLKRFTKEAEQQIDLSKAEPLLHLPPDHDRVTIQFAALNLTSPETVNIRYRLLGLDDRWEIADNQHQTQFTRLPAGKYTFELIAANNNSQWLKNKARLYVIVHPFFWETWWFRLLIAALTALAAGGLVFLGLRRRHRMQMRRLRTTRALEQERSRIARDIHDDLGASLTRISLLAQPAIEPQDAEVKKKLSQIHSTARHLMRSMDGVVWAINPEHDTFDELASYLCSYAQEFLNLAGIACRIRVPLDLPECKLSAQLRHNLLLAFKESLNNVVKYADATEVKIILEPEKDFALLQVKDNGNGIDPETSGDPSRPASGRGLANMDLRMNEIGGGCQIRSAPGEGTTVEFKIPLKEDI